MSPAPHPPEPAAGAPPSRPLRTLLSVGATVAVVGLLVGMLDLSAVGTALGAARPLPLLLAVLLSVGGRFVLDALRWRWLLQRLGCDVPVSGAVLLQSVSMPLRLVTPAKAGLLLCALYLARHHGMPLARGVSSVLLEKLHNLAFYLGAVALLPLLGAATVGEATLALSPALALAGSAAVVAGLVAVGAGLRWLQQRGPPAVLRRGRGARLWAALGELLAVFSWLGPGAQLGFFGITTAILALEFVEFHLIFVALGLPLGVVGSGYVMSLVVLISALPLTIGGVGTREAAALVLLAPVAPVETVAAAMAVLYAVHWLLPSLLGSVALPLFFRRLGGWGAIRGAVAEARAALARSAETGG